ncbi:hypothetical protein SMA5143A_6881 [Streptomyces sp. MA5143a]|nr:hypothetical protein SMA5143A_6881 [Streptomyces sp. MA5143a]
MPEHFLTGFKASFSNGGRGGDALHGLGEKVEIWFRVRLASHATTRHLHRTVTRLASGINNYVSAWNTGAKPFA